MKKMMVAIFLAVMSASFVFAKEVPMDPSQLKGIWEGTIEFSSGPGRGQSIFSVLEILNGEEPLKGVLTNTIPMGGGVISSPFENGILKKGKKGELVLVVKWEGGRSRSMELRLYADKKGKMYLRGDFSWDNGVGRLLLYKKEIN